MCVGGKEVEDRSIKCLKSEALILGLLTLSSALNAFENIVIL